MGLLLEVGVMILADRCLRETSGNGLCEPRTLQAQSP